MTRKAFESISADLGALYLWLDNPRLLTPQTDEMRCFEQLMSDNRFMALLNDIAKNGIGISPIVISSTDDTGYWVRDGNRRVAALKLLDAPEICPSGFKGVQKSIRSLSDKHKKNIPKQIECLYSDDEKAIQKYLFSTHTGEQGGIGQVDWNALMQAAFDYESGVNGKYSLSYRLLLLGKSYGFRFDNDFPITTLDRLPLADFCKRSKISVPKNVQKSLTIKNDSQSVIDAVVRVLSDVGDKNISVSTSDDGSTSVRGSGKPKEYIERIIGEYDIVRAAGEKSSGAKNFVSNQGGNDEPKIKQPTRKPNPAISEERAKFIPSKRFTKVPKQYVKESDIFSEMLKLKSQDVSITCIVMLRVFLESTLKVTAKVIGVRWKPGLGKMTETVALKLYELGDIDKPLRDSIVKLSGKEIQLAKAFFTIDTIQEFVHSAHAHPDKAIVNIFWNRLDPFIASCWDRVEKNDKEKG